MRVSSRSALLAFCVSLTVAGAAAAQTVVLFARGPSAAAFPAGTILPANKVITLKAGDTLELMDGSGSHVLNGPIAVTAGHVDAGARTKIIETFIKGQQTRPNVAATRGFVFAAPEPPRPTSALWAVDVGDGGTVCLTPNSLPMLTRGEADSPVALRITRTATGESQNVIWLPGSLSAEWPLGLIPADDDQFSVMLSDQVSTTVHVRRVEAPADGLAGLAKAFLERGCEAQLALLNAAVASQ